ncbi:MAG TPA: coniferyl aldehyde dehydrogenase [Rhodanobacteraceae bacterium]|jgi:coniferyl-aldehyde dehydrogenase|nr:coniferyl aldehyde dehydrogenase [Rhodanobacteraceae bacterium]
MAPNTIDDLGAVLQSQREAWRARQPDYAQRMDDLARLRAAFKARLEDFARVVSADFGRRPRHETLLSDGMTVLHAIDHARRHLKRWMRPQRVGTSWLFLPARSRIIVKPLGVIGIIAPWNYPVNLALIPLVDALAAGNHAMLKPSEHTPRTSALLQELLSDVFPRERVAVVQGDASVAAAFAALPFDHLFFTGSTATGAKVMAAAAANLTPVTLELGGKSPAIVAPGYPLKTAAERIATGKLLNAGQTCIASDYVLVPEAARDEFVQHLRDYVAGHYPALRESPDYASIVNDAHYARLRGYLDEARAAGATVIPLPDESANDAQARVLAPTLVLDANESLRAMHEEIFGPILPIVTYRSIEDAIAYVNARPRPLALYHFDLDRSRTRRVLEACIAGGVCVNDTVLHFVQSRLPFGGIGASGMGSYHGHAGFLTFSHRMAVFRQSRLSTFALLRPPYRRFADWMARFLTR